MGQMAENDGGETEMGMSKRTWRGKGTEGGGDRALGGKAEIGWGEQ